MTQLKPYLHFRYLILIPAPFLALIMASRCVWRRSFFADALRDFCQSYWWWIVGLSSEAIKQDAGWYRKWDGNSCGPWKWYWSDPGDSWSKEFEGAWPVE